MRLAMVMLACCMGCEAVPMITYTNDSDAAADANTCPDLVPSYATSCCGVIPCFGANCPATCADCQSCSPLDLCCPNSQNKAICKSSLRCP